MDSTYFTKPLLFLIQTAFGLYTTLVMLRFLLQWVRADFYNPISRFVVEMTTPLLRPLRRIIPGIGGMDLASLLLVWLLKTLEIFLILLIVGYGFNLAGAVLWAIPKIAELLISIFVWAILIQVIFSWIDPEGYNPAAALAHSLSEPFVRPAQQLLPPIAGMDFSPMLAAVGLKVLEMLLLPPLNVLTGSPFGSSSYV